MPRRLSLTVLAAAVLTALTTLPFLGAGWRLARAGYFGGPLSEHTAEGIQAIGFTGAVLGMAGAAGMMTLGACAFILTMALGLVFRLDAARHSVTLAFVLFQFTGWPLVIAGLMDPAGAPNVWQGVLTLSTELLVLALLWLPKVQDEFEDVLWYRDHRGANDVDRLVKQWRKALQGAMPEDFYDRV